MNASSFSVICILLFSSIILYAQEEVDFKKDFRYNISKSQTAPKIDGILDDPIWNSTEIAGNFWQKSPYFEEGANPKTEVRLTYDENYLYVGAKCYQTEDVIIESLKRDNFWRNDGIAIILDPLDSRANSVLFGTSAVGVQWDAVRTETSDINSDWSNKWFVETQITDEYWSAEFAIPFRILRYNQTLKEWGLNFVRNVTYANQYHNWTAVPEGFWPPNPAFSGALVWDNPPTKKKGNFNLIPFITSSVNKSVGEDTEYKINGGLDAKLAITSTLNMDFTVNPDFSQIEADELVTNLTRFDISLPEKRTFFLENADLFADFGTGGMRPFFSRRIGLDENFQSVPILYGLRLTGNVTQDIRLGVMNIQSRSTDTALGQNQSAVSIKKQFGRSFIQGMFLNRQAFDGTETVEGDYGRNASVEGLYASENGKLGIWGATHASFKEGYSKNNFVFNTGFQYTNSTWEIITDNIFFQENYFADMGFTARVNNYDAARDTIIRVGYNSNYSSIDYKIRPQKKKITLHRFGIENLTLLNQDLSFNEQWNRLRYFISFINTSEFRIRYDFNELELLFPFSFTGDVPLPAQRYRTSSLQLQFDSDRRKKISYTLSAKSGGFYNGRLSTMEANINYRIQPWGNFSLGYQINDLNFPDPYGSATIRALVSKVEIGFNKNLLWTTLFQFVDQSDFMGINSRLQWRFSPMSDLFLVFVDNYDIIPNPNTISSNNRALILKLNYWY